MKLAILGTDAEIRRLAAAARDERHEIVWLGDVRPEDVPAIGPLTAGLIDQSNEWELLLGREVVDAVLVGRGMASSESHVERIKRLVTEAVPLLVVHPAFDSVLPYYEVDMVRRESRAIVQHYNPLIGHPFALEVAEWLRAGHPEVGSIHQLTCERRVNVATRNDVLAHFSRDVELLAAIAGDVRRVTAIGPAEPSASFASLQTQMTSSIVGSLRWSVGYATTGSTGLELSLLGENGVVTVRVPAAANVERVGWQVETAVEGHHDIQTLDEYDTARVAIARLSDAVSESELERRASSSTWEAATRAMEVVDAAELSLQKGRTIEVYKQQLTERLAFRGTMAAIGCGLLLVVFLALVAVGLLGGAEGIVRQRLAPSWHVAILALLAFFLLLQAVPLLVQKPKADRAETQATQPDPRDS